MLYGLEVCATKYSTLLDQTGQYDTFFFLLAIDVVCVCVAAAVVIVTPPNLATRQHNSNVYNMLSVSECLSVCLHNEENDMNELIKLRAYIASPHIHMLQLIVVVFSSSSNSG